MAPPSGTMAAPTDRGTERSARPSSRPRPPADIQHPLMEFGPDSGRQSFSARRADGERLSPMTRRLDGPIALALAAGLAPLAGCGGSSPAKTIDPTRVE